MELNTRKRQKEWRRILFVFGLVIFLALGATQVTAEHLPELIKGQVLELGDFEKKTGEYDGTWTTHISANGKVVTAFEAPEEYQNEVEFTEETEIVPLGGEENLLKLDKAYNQEPGSEQISFKLPAEGVFSQGKLSTELKEGAGWEVGYWVKNARVWDEAKRQYLTVDIRHRVTEISKAQSMVPNVDGYYLCFEPKQMPNFSMLGLDGVTINTEFFKAGTTNLADVKNRVVVKTNITYSDIDWNEGFYAPDVATDLDNKAVIGFITLENTATEAFLQVTENKVWRYSLNSDTNTGDPATSVGAYFDRSAYRTTYFSTNPRQILTVPKAGDPSGWTTAAYFQTLMGATEIRNTPPEISELKPQGNQTGKEAVKISAKFKDGNNDALRVSCQLTLPDGTVAYGTKGRISGEGIKDSETFWEKGGVIPQRSKGKEPAVLQITHGVTEKGEILTEEDFSAQAGSYKIKWSAWDDLVPGTTAVEKIGNYEIQGKANLQVEVSHEPIWDIKRNQHFNATFFRNYLDYKQAEVSMEDYLTFPVSEKQPRPRFHNVFWPGENVIYRATLTYDKKFMVPEKVLASLVTPSGNPCKNPVTGELYEQVQLTPEGPPKDLGNSKQSISFRGEIWDPSMIEKGGKLVPEEIRLRVKLFYHNKENGELKQQIAEGERVIIMDNERPYYDPHFD